MAGGNPWTERFHPGDLVILLRTLKRSGEYGIVTRVLASSDEIDVAMPDGTMYRADSRNIDIVHPCSTVITKALRAEGA